MNFQIENEYLTVCVSDVGAELQSVSGKDGTEYLWNGDPNFWSSHAPVLFPFCGRIWNDLATADGVPCNPGRHGFLRGRQTKMANQKKDEISFVLTENEETLAKYPYAFCLTVTYRLKKNELIQTARVENTGEKTLPYAYGGHPAFRVPFAGGKMSDYQLIFDTPYEKIEKLNFDPENCYLTGGSTKFTIPNGKMDVKEEDYAHGSMFLLNVPANVTLENKNNHRFIKVHCPGFYTVGLWKKPDAPFLCIEPWDGTPATLGESTELTTKAGFTNLAPGKTKEHTFSMIFD